MIFKKVDRMTTAIYFNKMTTQRIARGNSERKDCSGKRDGETTKNYVKKTKPNSKMN